MYHLRAYSLLDIKSRLVPAPIFDATGTDRVGQAVHFKCSCAIGSNGLSEILQRKPTLADVSLCPYLPVRRCRLNLHFRPITNIAGSQQVSGAPN